MVPLWIVVHAPGISRVSSVLSISIISRDSNTFQECFKRQQDFSSVSRAGFKSFKSMPAIEFRNWIKAGFVLNHCAPGISRVSRVSSISSVSRDSNTFQECFKR